MTTFFATEVDRAAHEHAIRASVVDVVTTLREMLGATLVAYLGGVKETRAVTQWANGERSPAAPAEQRLRTALQVAEVICHRDDARVARAWFQGMNPQLEDTAPARVLREQPLESAGPAVIAAARSFVSA